MSKWKLQGVQPDTCESPGCSYIELWDVEETPPRTHTVVAFDNICSAHEANIPTDVMLWADGNWKNKKEYIQYQKDWFKHQNNVKWKIENPDEKMPPQIANFGVEPPTTGSVSPPSQIQQDEMSKVYNWNKEDNIRKNEGLAIAKNEGIENDSISWEFSGKGNSRKLNIIVSGTNQQRNRIQSALDIQFGIDTIDVTKV